MLQRRLWKICKVFFSFQESLDEVFVKYLQTEEDAILDHDDVIVDVCDDKDKVCFFLSRFIPWIFRGWFFKN